MNNLYRLDEMFIKIRTYLEQNPCASICEMSEEFGMEEETLFKYYKENRTNILFG
jgi:hypothetical protein